MIENSNWCHRLCSLDFPTNGYLAHNYGTKSPITCLPFRCLVRLLSCCSQVFNGIVEWIAWTFRYWHQESSVCSLEHKAYVRAVLNRNQHAIWAIWDFSGTLLRDWLLLMSGSSCTTILSDSFPLYFCGCFVVPWPVYLKSVWSILLSCSQIFDQMCSLRLDGLRQALNVIVCGCVLHGSNTVCLSSLVRVMPVIIQAFSKKICKELSFYPSLSHSLLLCLLTQFAGENPVVIHYLVLCTLIQPVSEFLASV